MNRTAGAGSVTRSWKVSGCSSVLARIIAQSVLVLSKGRVVESGPVDRVFERPEDPYTVRLMEDVPKLPRGGHESGPGGEADGEPDGRLIAT